MSPVRSDAGCQERDRRLRQFSDQRDPEIGELSERHPPHAPEVPNRQCVEEVELRPRRDDEGAVRLRHTACDLGQELRLRPPNGYRQAGLRSHAASDPFRDRGRRPEQVNGAPDVDECLIDRDRLNKRAEVPKDIEDSVAEVHVVTEGTINHDEAGTEFPGLPDSHRTTDAHRPGLIRGREYDPATHGDRLADQVRTA